MKFWLRSNSVIKWVINMKYTTSRQSIFWMANCSTLLLRIIPRKEFYFTQRIYKRICIASKSWLSKHQTKIKYMWIVNSCTVSSLFHQTLCLYYLLVPSFFIHLVSEVLWQLQGSEGLLFMILNWFLALHILEQS